MQLLDCPILRAKGCDWVWGSPAFPQPRRAHCRAQGSHKKPGAGPGAGARGPARGSGPRWGSETERHRGGLCSGGGRGGGGELSSYNSENTGIQSQEAGSVLGVSRWKMTERGGDASPNGPDGSPADGGPGDPMPLVGEARGPMSQVGVWLQGLMGFLLRPGRPEAEVPERRPWAEGPAEGGQGVAGDRNGPRWRGRRVLTLPQRAEFGVSSDSRLLALSSPCSHS